MALVEQLMRTPLHFLQGPHEEESNMNLLVECPTELPRRKAHTCRLLTKSDGDRICVVPVLTRASMVSSVLPVLMDKSQA